MPSITLVRSAGAPEPPSTNAIVLADRLDGAEDLQTQVEKLGRQRPEVFKTMWHELGFCFSLLASMLMAVCLRSSITLRKAC